jgi:NADH dehydrogenase FAD-containing subunit
MKRLLLIGAGHAHAQVVKDWITSPVPGCELVLVSPSALAPYSGMVPGWLDGTYRFEEICIDFAALLAKAGARLVIDELVSLDLTRRQVKLRSGDAIAYDLLSINVGSTLTPPAATGRMQVLSLRPL